MHNTNNSKNNSRKLSESLPGSSYAAAISNAVSSTPVTQPISSSQVINNTHGYVYTISPWESLRRFLVTGALGGTFYQDSNTFVKQQLTTLNTCLNSDPDAYLKLIEEVSVKGLAMKQDPAIFALAYAAAVHPNSTVRNNALVLSEKVCRTASTFFYFLQELKGLRSSNKLTGRAIQRCISNWYNSKHPDALAYQLVKYRNRNNFTHKDAISLGHVKPISNTHNNLFNWVVTKAKSNSSQLLTDGKIIFNDFPKIIYGYEEINKSNISICDAIKIIEDYKLPWEAIPTGLLVNPQIWEALYPQLPLTALLRNLGKLTSLGLLGPFSNITKDVVNKLSNQEYLLNSRIHPINLLTTYKTYSSGSGVKGNLYWTPNSTIVAALDSAFYKCYGNVPTTGKNILVALDVSWSMSHIIPNTQLKSCEVTAAMSLIWLNTESSIEVVGFSGNVVNLGINKSDSIEQACKKVVSNNFGSTNPSSALLYAKERNYPLDSLIVITDNEVNGGGHVSATLNDFRRAVNKPTKLFVLGTTATNFSIGDPDDPYTFNLAGFSSDTPALVNSLIAE